MFRQKNKYTMNPEAASATLQKVFDSVEKVPNNVPFDKLLLRKKPTTIFFDYHVFVCILLLVITLAAPVFVVPLASFTGSFISAEPVRLDSHHRSGDMIYLTFTGDNIDPDNAYLVTTDGTVYEPLSYDYKTQTFKFPFIEDQESNIYIPVADADSLHFLLTPDKAVQ